FFLYYTSLLTHGPHEETPDPKHPGKRLPKGFDSNVDYLDVVVGRLIDRLKDEGLDKNTILIFIGDNGTAGHGKGTATELGAHVPFIAWGPGWIHPHPKAVGALSDVTDIFPTLAEFAEAPLPKDILFDGRSLVPLLTGKTDSHRDWIYSHLDDGRVLRDSRWLLELRGGDKPARFYDCGEDRMGADYRLLQGELSSEASEARKRFESILATMPEPKKTEVDDQPERKKKNADE
ncbi:MAG: sulfatase-like hydrolase/transferase, partial [Pirellulales bacterium]